MPLLAPLLRSDAQGRLLAELYLNSDREFTASELARRVETSLSNASRELDRLARAGYLRERRSGRNRYLRADRTHPLFGPVEQLVRYAYGPVAVLRPLISEVEGVVEAFIYGSWAARLQGEPGEDPHDIDVLVVGDRVDLGALDRVAERARRDLGREVNARAVREAAWRDPEDPFLRHVRLRPRVSVLAPGHV